MLDRAGDAISVTALASGIARDLNNVLAPIIMGATLLRDPARDDSARNLITMMEKSAQRGAGIVRQVFAFARGSEGQRGRLQLKHLTVLGIAEGHGGFIRVESRVGQGTTFELLLPAAAGDHSAPAVPTRSAGPWRRSDGDLVLVVDDEAAVREVARQALEEFGHRVIFCASGPEAIHWFKRQSTEVRPVVTDMMIPEMDGPALVEALRTIQPGAKIIGITGAADATLMLRLEGLGLDDMIAKPFTIERLLELTERATASRDR